MPKRKGGFTVQIAKNLLVLAFRQGVARKKVERTLGAERKMGVDVAAAGRCGRMPRPWTRVNGSPKMPPFEMG